MAGKIEPPNKWGGFEGIDRTVDPVNLQGIRGQPLTEAIVEAAIERSKLARDKICPTCEGSGWGATPGPPVPFPVDPIRTTADWIQEWSHRLISCLGCGGRGMVVVYPKP